MEYIIIISGVINFILIYICYNLYIKNIKFENLIIDINNSIHDALENMREIDHKGVFEADDEVGYSFKSLLQILNELQQLIYVEKEKE